ncbi:hypothetical protein Ami103574_14965 [Aminipila butyrica]|uniref:MurNAc-LAA domain-containing protein n=1 Tax=Aminipila butyrica TaxID=433296 RepID=A0A858BYI2_9FIRM|nr:N-acetylmuramoyl-L-alanine amidase [Aminipila butyrica]QIB70512.1 hypothetical protein Ami103574_14965 [Aminipila butyrica]
MRGNNPINKLKYAVCIGVLCLVTAAVPMYHEVLRSVEQLTSADVLLIDPGHGGMDGGAESAKGICEKNINLAISKEIQQLAQADGWTVVLTREEDISLGEEAKGSIRSKKTKDLLERKRILAEVKPTAAISIHLNSFREDRRVHGAQAFYPAGSETEAVIAESKRLAEAIQEQLNQQLQPEEERTALSKSGVLILKNPVSPITIIECGFLSNSQEAEKLEDVQYQKDIAASIYQGVMDFSHKEAKKKVKVLDSL